MEDNNLNIKDAMMTVAPSSMKEEEPKWTTTTTTRRNSFRHLAQSFFLRRPPHHKKQSKSKTIVPHDASSHTEQCTIFPDQSWSTDQSHEEEEEEGLEDDDNFAQLLEWSPEDKGLIVSPDDNDDDVDIDIDVVVGTHRNQSAVVVEDDKPSMASFISQSSSSASSLVSEQSENNDVKKDIPWEITVIDEGGALPPTTPTKSPASSSCHDDTTTSVYIQRQQRQRNNNLGKAQVLDQSYLAKLQSTEQLVDTLTVQLQKTQGYAEHLLLQNETLEDVIQDMERSEAVKNDLLALFKILMCFSLFYYTCGGTDLWLIVSVVLYLFAELACVLA
jgi:hypothetical protein